MKRPHPMFWLAGMTVAAFSCGVAVAQREWAWVAWFALSTVILGSAVAINVVFARAAAGAPRGAGR